MQKQGLVRMEPDKTDRRSIRIFLIKEGRRLKPKLLPKVAEINKIALKNVNNEERELLLSVLKKIHGNAVAATRS
jgi:DNA-binding MarR family transcriptional regulator